jgi:cyanophycinase
VIELSGDRRADHVAWRRAAMARKAGDFPPAEFPAPEPLEGTIVVIGGGRVPKRGLEAFISASGGKDAPIAVINSALGDPPPRTAADLGAFDTLGATNTYLLHAPTRAEAASEEFIAQLDRAGGVWFTGGRQWRLVDRYLETDVVDALQRVLARGGAVGGTSAGATICGDYLVRGDPLTNRTVMAEGYERGFALLPGLAIDQHFDSRKRLPGLIALKRHYPQLLAIGLDETTAAIITGTKMRIAGLGKVTVLDRPLPAGEPKPGNHYTVLNRGDQFDLRKREVVFRWPLGDR